MTSELVEKGGLKFCQCLPAFGLGVVCGVVARNVGAGECALSEFDADMLDARGDLRDGRRIAIVRKRTAHGGERGGVGFAQHDNPRGENFGTVGDVRLAQRIGGELRRRDDSRRKHGRPGGIATQHQRVQEASARLARRHDDQRVFEIKRLSAGGVCEQEVADALRCGARPTDKMALHGHGGLRKQGAV